VLVVDWFADPAVFARLRKRISSTARRTIKRAGKAGARWQKSLRKMRASW
jgi:hypothetical protein